MRRLMMLGTGALSMLVGSLYVRRVFGPTEAEVAGWGLWCLIGGVLAIIAGALPLRYAWIRLPAVLGFVVLAAAQLPPIAAWFLFHGSMISDGFPPTEFRAHWAWALPHMLLLAAAVSAAAAIWREDMPPA